MSKLKSVVKELQRRSSKPFNLEEFLFDKQLLFVRDPAPFKVAKTSRRAGKSVSCAGDLVDTANHYDEVVCLYITLSRNNAKKLVWPEIKRIVRRFSLNAEFNESELSVTFSNGSIIYLSGASDRTEIEKFRGLALKKVYIDECQSFPAYIADLIDEVIAPCLMDYAGSLSLIGTPAPIPVGYFEDAFNSPSWSAHHWTFFDNPHIPIKSGMSHQDVLNRELKRRGVSMDHPSIQREWFGRSVLDADSLVFKYSSQINHYEHDPLSECETFIMGVDLGFDDADAICILGFGPHSKTTYLLHETVAKRQDLTSLMEQIQALRVEYKVSKIVMDTGGLGKKISEELIRRYQIPVQPAEKTRKFEYIELLNDALRTSKLKAKQDSRFAGDCMRVEYDLDKCTPDRKVVSKRFHSDIADAVLYAFRESMAFTFAPEAPKAEVGSPQWLEELEEAALEHFTALEKAEKDPFNT